MFITQLVLIVSLLCFILGIFTWVYNYKSRVHTLFGISTSLVGLWIFLNYIFQRTNSVWALRSIYAIAPFILASIAVWITSLKYKVFKKDFVWLNVAVLVVNFFVVVLSLCTTTIVVSVTNFYQYQTGSLFSYYTLYNLLLFIIYIVYFIWEYRRADKIFRDQIRLIMIGVGITVAVAATVGFILPAMGITRLNVLDSPSSIFFVFFSVYSIMKYKFLDVKVIAAEVFVTLLIVLNFVGLFNVENSSEFVTQLFIFVVTCVFGVSLIRSVITEVRRREEIANLAHNLERANIRLQELDKQKTEFLSIASHQLRTPLSATRGFIELIKDGAYGKVGAKVVAALNDVDINNDRLVKLVDEFLDISRIEQGRTKFTFAPANINDTIASVAQELHERAVEHGSKVVWEKDASLPSVTMDEEKVRHVVMNFIDNGIKYGNQTDIVVVAKIEDSGLAVRVSDHGLGFGQKDEVSFFQKFYRGENVNGINVNGTGLGLYVCRKFIEAHGGRVWAHSTGLGEGSEFGFWIPLKPAANISN